MRSLKEVNSQVNEKCTWVSDQEVFDQLEYWEDILKTGRGDCEDHAIAKFHLLRESGWPLEAFKLGLCWVETGEYHCVLVVTENNTDWVLDNRYPYPMEWKMLPYRWDRFYNVAEGKWRLYGG